MHTCVKALGTIGVEVAGTDSIAFCSACVGTEPRLGSEELIWYRGSVCASEMLWDTLLTHN